MAVWQGLAATPPEAEDGTCGMQFGLLYELQTPPGRREYDIYHQALEQIELADELGFDYVWEVEHHFLEGYSHSSASEVFLGAVSQRTRRIRIGHGVVTLLPAMNPPARVAERTAALDILCDGRLEVGTGRASTPEELGGFNVDPEATRAMWQESLAEIVKMWTETPYPGHDGRFFSMPSRNVIPKPLQQPHPPLWLACTDPATVETAARHGVGVLSFSIGAPEKAAERVRSYRELAAQGRPIGRYANTKVAATSFMYCGESEAEARRHGIPPAQYFNEQLQRYFTAWNRPDYTGASYAGHKDVYKVRPGGVDAEHLVENGTWLIGSPASLRRTLARWQGTGVDQMILMVQLGYAEHGRIMASLRRFAEEVMPHVRDASAGQERAAGPLPVGGGD
jgi:alkanesulfonate monooxygenase SsuD/methylene tetrahydromethanopterin reductase-like flavin-dependent oxidoreductase (luciferase family)